MTYLSDEVRARLEEAQTKKAKRRSRVRVETGDRYFPVLRLWDTGFSIDSEETTHLRGLVDIYDGPRHVCQALIVKATDAAGERRYEFKRNTVANDAAPLDFAREEPQPIALIQGLRS